MFPRGSEWRRWDLHVHTPDTALNNQFGTWEEYLAAVEAQDAVRVIGVTDYMTIENYSKLRKLKSQGRLKNIDLLIPNIEFRIAPQTERATQINIHLLVSPDDPDHETHVLNALGRLDWEYNKRTYSCLPAQLIALGKAFDSSAQSDKAALAVGVTQFKIDFTKLRDWYFKDPWLRENALVAVSAGVDGLSAFRKDGAWAALREEITRFSHVIFSGRPGERSFWLGEGSQTDRETLARLGGEKPCVHGSDAHQLSKLFRPDQDRFCWIKADATFEGLRQIMFEPSDRVHIGPTPPILHDQARTIRSVAIKNSHGWFKNDAIEFNAGLVSIIGQKGSGKSALAELIAYAAGSWKADDEGSFLQRAGDHLKGCELEITWGDGRKSSAIIGRESGGKNDVRYLSQKFVERLCSDDRLGTELVREIEAVIFAYLDPTDTMSASDFSELRSIRTAGVRSELDRIRTEINALISEEWVLRGNAAKVPEKEARIRALEEEQRGLLPQLPGDFTPEEQLIQNKLQAYRNELQKLTQGAAQQKQALVKINDIRLWTASFKNEMNKFAAEAEAQLKMLGFTENDRLAFRPTFPRDTESVLARREAQLRHDLGLMQGEENNPRESTIRWYQSQIQVLLSRESADKARQEQIKIIQSRLAIITREIARLQAEIEHINGPESLKLDMVRKARSDAYVNFFATLKLEQETLEALYAPVSARLRSAAATEQEQSLELSIRWQADLDVWLERGAALFDQRKTIPYGTMQGLADASARILKPAWISGDPEKIRPAMTSFLSAFNDQNLPPERYMRSGVTVQDISQWLYEVGHISLSYGLKYNGVELEKLSPGTKGIVLLILYLGMDVQDTRPLIVDQPDENLDNESIYSLLTMYFRNAKLRRQILLITHNPNLVVNTDTEQVVVATGTRRQDGLPAFEYKSGSLENASPPQTGIRQQVCRILEGGETAFRRRERRYALA